MTHITKIGIIGCGKVAHLHARAISNIESAELVGVWSRTPSTAKSFAIHYGVNAHQDITSMIVDLSIDLVIVCTPHPFHKDPTITAAKAGAHILVEKPLASSLQDCDAMITALKRQMLSWEW